MKPSVAIVRVENDIPAAIRQALSMAVGPQRLFAAGEKVILKPNFVAPRKSHTGATTDLRWLEELAAWVRERGGVPVLYETPALEWEWREVYRILDVFELARRLDLEILTGTTGMVRIPVPGCRVSFQIPDIFLRMPFINLPKLKTHVSTGLSCGAKNLLGILPAAEKRRAHIRGISRSVELLNQVLKPCLNVVDAGVVMGGNGPTYGEPVRMGLVVAGLDTRAVDAVCARLLGRPSATGRLLPRLTAPADSTQYICVGEQIETVSMTVTPPAVSRIFEAFFRCLLGVDQLVYAPFKRGPLNKVLYNTGWVGNNPRLQAALCTRCGDCVRACPSGSAIDLERMRIHPGRCLRCWTCIEVCPEGAVTARGLIRPGPPTRSLLPRVP